MAGRALGDWDEQVRQVLGGVSAAVVGDDLIEVSIGSALVAFSNDRPLQKQADLAGNGVLYQFALPAGWVVGFSNVILAEYPTGLRPPSYLDLQEVHPYPDSDQATALMFDLTTPQAGSSIRITYTAEWPMPDSTPATDLTAATDFDALCHLAAYYVAGKKSADAAGNTRSGFPSANLAGLDTESERWQSIARWARKVYDEHMGGDGAGDPLPASGTLDWDAQSDYLPLGGRWITHRTRR